MTVTWCQQGAGRGRASGVLPRVSNRKARGERSWAWARKTRRLEARAAVSLVVFRGGHARPRPVIVARRCEAGRVSGPMMATTAYPVAACSSTQLRAARGRRMTTDSAPAA